MWPKSNLNPDENKCTGIRSTTAYPNPTSGKITLQLQGKIEGNLNLSIIDQQGRKIFNKQFGHQNTNLFSTVLQTKGLSKGHYIVQVTVGDQSYTHKILIQ